ncbi:hypothetical protein KAM385_07330 [Aeromonas hydrophila]|nr:hypothetical protein KAM385_07330 [Aeromonas hydrophila]
MLGTTEKPAVRSDPRLEPTVQGPKPATASPGYQQQKPVTNVTGFFFISCAIRSPLPPPPSTLPQRQSHQKRPIKNPPAWAGLFYALGSDSHLLMG